VTKTSISCQVCCDVNPERVQAADTCIIDSGWSGRSWCTFYTWRNNTSSTCTRSDVAPQRSPPCSHDHNTSTDNRLYPSSLFHTPCTRIYNTHGVPCTCSYFSRSLWLVSYPYYY